ncbi:hypothetical protein CYLTODRAFT_386998 [Cylindrobasidium torrendii FP15055 ss-10]|uniref:Protein ZIP4 homolog n=1 Tax=Cylindrobasidium torrendii FP15055 ss-10 TaxID=1314674 RepID=A0A0D7BT88_9AGAR|nr:hypothetical protein CYLTODRAFT_386998 [Cylindrobasidium torrendii FP15055 ss-10]
MMEAGLEADPGMESLINILNLASKTGATLAESGRNDQAAIILTCAAKYEDLVRNRDKTDKTHDKAKASAIVVYLTCRMEAAAAEGNFSVAEYMADRVTTDDARLVLLPVRERTIIAYKLHEIGKTLLNEKTAASSQGPAKLHESVSWIQKAFTMAEHEEGDKDTDKDSLKVCALLFLPFWNHRTWQYDILRTLARAYFKSNAYEEAEATLDELFGNIGDDDDTATPRNADQELRWLRLSIMKKRNASEQATLRAFQSIIDHMELTEPKLTDILQELRTISHQQTLVSSVHMACLKRSLGSKDNGENFVDRLLLSLIVHTSKDEDHSRAMDVLNEAFGLLYESDYTMGDVPSTACITLLWQYGDRQYNMKKFGIAADWFLVGAHAAFSGQDGIGVSGTTKCLRKAALCYVEDKQYAQASAVLRRCDPKEAATHYVKFLISVKQGIDDVAIKAVQDMATCEDFNRKMLLLATQISHASENKAILLAALKALLVSLELDHGAPTVGDESGDKSGKGHGVVEAMTLIRCIVKLVLRIIVEPAANKQLLVDTMLEHFRTAVKLVAKAQKEKTAQMVTKDVSWLWRTAYNCAVQGCSEWEDEARIAALFDVARELLEAVVAISLVDLEPEIYLHLAITSFAAASGRVFSLRAIRETDVDASTRVKDLASELNACRRKIFNITDSGVITDENDLSRLQYFIHTLRVFEVEMLAWAADWDGVSNAVNDTVAAGPLAASTYEAIADILWIERDCPMSVLYEALEAILHASLDHGSLSVDKFSRWVRAICTIMLAKNSAAERVKAIGYVEQAVTVMERNLNGEYLSAIQISETYAELLSRYTPR